MPRKPGCPTLRFWGYVLGYAVPSFSGNDANNGLAAPFVVLMYFDALPLTWMGCIRIFVDRGAGMIKEVFSVAEAAGLLGCHPQTLRLAIKNGKLQAARLGKNFAISRPALEDYFAAAGGGKLFANDAAGSDPSA